jgi:hypothetical protein
MEFEFESVNLHFHDFKSEWMAWHCMTDEPTDGDGYCFKNDHGSNHATQWTTLMSHNISIAGVAKNCSCSCTHNMNWGTNEF